MTMRKLITFISALLIAATIMGQSPGSFKYQSVLRDARGNLRTNTSVNIKIDILSGNKNGPVVFSETQKVISDGNGIINLNIGSVSSGTAIFAVNWKSGEYFIRVTVDGIDMGTSQLLSVPYALYVYKAGNDFNGSYYDLINKPVLFNGTWSKLTGKPSFAKVATSGKYSDLINKPPKTTGTVTNVTATAPVIVANGSSTPLLSMMPANGSTSGYLSSSDWTMFNNKGTFDGTWMSLSGKPSLAIVATTGSYNDLINKPKGNNSGDMQFWNGSDWDIIPVGQPGQRLQIAQTKIPAWNGSAFLTLTTNPITNLAQTTATSGGSVSVAGGSPVIARGVCWSTSENPTVVNSKTIDGAGIGNFTSSMTGLTAGTTYYVRAYATNSEGTSYGNQLSFTTTASGSGNIRYIRFESYYSGDNEQVNVYEIQAYEGAVNVALNKPGYANSYEGGNWASNGSQAVDGNGNSRWSSNRSDPGPDPANPHFIVIDLQNLTSIDSIILNIKGFDSWLQTFDLSVSADSVNWQSVGSGQNITGIFTYKLNGNNTPYWPRTGLGAAIQLTLSMEPVII